MLSTGYYHTRVHDAQMYNTTTKAGRRLDAGRVLTIFNTQGDTEKNNT